MQFSVAPVVGGGAGWGGLNWSLNQAWDTVNSSPWVGRAFLGPELVWQASRLRFALMFPVEAMFRDDHLALTGGAKFGVGLAF